MKTITMLMVASLSALVIFPMINFADAQTEGKEYVKLRNEVWNLFFRMTTAAFVVGAVVSGTLIWLVWRFRESHPKNKNPTKWETGEEVH